MKIDKRNVRHLGWVVAFLANVVIATVLRLALRRPTRSRVILYGHKLSGNLLAIYKHLRESSLQDIEVAFLSLDPAYYQELVKGGESCLLATSPRSIRWLATADAIISDHGLHALLPMLYLSDMKFFDVWHGIPFKGFDANDFRVQHRYDEIWVASPLLARMYVERYGFAVGKLKVTGYARTDRLVRHDEDTLAIKRRFGLDGADVGKIVLFAPTWKQDESRRSIYPFGLGEQEFLEALSACAQRTGSTFVIRAHLNSGAGENSAWSRIEHRPHALFPDTEELLLISDLLVCDWSSIAFDYLLLERPTIFLDVAAPFAKGFSLGSEYRFGPIAPNMDELLGFVKSYLQQPSEYAIAFGEKAADIRRAVYGEKANGTATEDCVNQLRQVLALLTS